MLTVNPFNLNGAEAVITSAVWCIGISFWIYRLTNCAADISASICRCVKDSVVAWAERSVVKDQKTNIGLFDPSKPA